MRLRDGISVFQRIEDSRQLGCGQHAVELRGLSDGQKQVLDLLNYRYPPAFVRVRSAEIIHPREWEALEDVLTEAGALDTSESLPSSDEERRLVRRDGDCQALGRRRRMRVQLRVFPCDDTFQLIKMRPYLQAVVSHLFNYGFTDVGLEYLGTDYPPAVATQVHTQIDGRLTKLKSPTHVVAIFPHHAGSAQLVGMYREGIDHLLVVIGDTEVQVGPFVRVHSGPCAHCLDFHERDLDRSSPLVAAQARSQDFPALTADLSDLAAMHTARAVADEADRRGWVSGEARYLDADLLVERFQWSQHAHCPHHLTPISDEDGEGS